MEVSGSFQWTLKIFQKDFTAISEISFQSKSRRDAGVFKMLQEIPEASG